MENLKLSKNSEIHSKGNFLKSIFLYFAINPGIMVLDIRNFHQIATLHVYRLGRASKNLTTFQLYIDKSSNL